ncbi:MAG: hypothetical protein MJA31_19380 [Clostridia bacterium]|nr:hypothetical protein [Clostridia bacterium]
MIFGMPSADFCILAIWPIIWIISSIIIHTRTKKEDKQEEAYDLNLERK